MQSKKVIGIQSGRKTESPEDHPPTTPAAKKKYCENHMTRRTFAGLFFGMGMGTWKAARKSGLPPSVADEELRRYGYNAWALETGRKAA